MPDLTPAQQAELADLMLALGHSPKGRKQIAQLVREHADNPKIAQFIPNFSDIPADDPPPADPKLKPLTQADLDAQFEAREGRRRAASEKQLQTEARQELLDSGRFTTESIKGLDSFMEDNGYSNVEHAAVIYAHQNPPERQAPTIGNSRTWELPGGDIRKDPKKYALNAAYQVVDELRRGRA